MNRKCINYCINIIKNLEAVDLHRVESFFLGSVCMIYKFNGDETSQLDNKVTSEISICRDSDIS